MERYDRAFSRAAGRLNGGATQTMKDMAEGRFPQEPEITTALVTRWQDKLDGFAAYGIDWSAKILSSRGPGTEESRFGADFLGVLRLDLPSYQMTKGFLAQAKRQEPGSRLDQRQWNELKTQCDRMLQFSSESFVFVYSQNDVFILPAINVLACPGPVDLHTLHPRKTSPFFNDHFRCFIGDRRIDSVTPATLENLFVRHVLEVRARSEVK